MTDPHVRVVGVPTEIKPDERRVALTPNGVRELTRRGVRVLIQTAAGHGASLSDDAYCAAGAELVATATEVWERADLVCKVKEPQPEEFAHLRADLTLFTFLHLAAYPAVAEALRSSEATGLAYETVQRADGQLPLLAPMSEVAGRLAVQAGARFLEAPQGGRGVLLGGVPGVRPGRVTVLGAGTVGVNAARIAVGMGAEVALLDTNLDRLRFVDHVGAGRITTLASNQGTIERCLAESDLVIGAVLVAGQRAPIVVSDEMVRTMQKGAVIVDVAIDQGGCVATSRETSHRDPVFQAHDVVHYCVGNIPGAVPHTSTHALTNATLPYVVAVAVNGVDEACRLDTSLAPGLNTALGSIVNPAVAESLVAAHA
jgi:alanine dehydrogenase